MLILGHPNSVAVPARTCQHQLSFARRAVCELYKPPRFKGGTFASYGPRGDVCQQRAKYAISIDNLLQKYKREEVCKFYGHTMLANVSF